MIDRIFFSALAVCLWATGALAMTEAITEARVDGAQARAAPVRVVQLAPVVITAKRLATPATLASSAAAETAVARAE